MKLVDRVLHVGTKETSTLAGAVGQMKGVAVVSATLSLSIALIESLAMAGLITLLTSGSGSLDLQSDLTRSVANGPAVLGLAAGSMVLNLIQTWIRMRVTTEWELRQRLALIDAFRHADFSTQANYSSGRLSVDGEYIAAGSSTIGGIIGLIGFAARAAVYSAVSLVASWQVALIAVACGSVLVLLLRVLSRRTRRLNDRVAGDYRNVSEDIADLAPTARELHMLNRWPVTTDQLGAHLTAIRKAKYTAGVLAGMVGPIYAMGTLMVGVGVAYWATGQTGHSTARLAISGLLLIRALGSAQSTQVGFQSVNDSRPFLDRGIQAIEDLRRAARVADKVDPPITEGPHRIAVRGASVSYGNDTVVRSVDLELEGSGGVALIGPSGAGKSTTLMALSGLLRPDSGSVAFDGTDLAGLDLAAVTERIGYLPQDPRLIRATLRDNLVRWPLELADDRITGLLERIALLDTVRGFDGGLDARMGRAAEGLSGGELQRLGLVRLLVARPPVMLLDEPTSALDRENADRVAGLIAGAMADRLVVVVTHRPDLLVHCREVVYMEGGQILDRGTLQEVSGRHPFVSAMAQGLDVEGTALRATS